MKKTNAYEKTRCLNRRTVEKKSLFKTKRVDKKTDVTQKAKFDWLNIKLHRKKQTQRLIKQKNFIKKRCLRRRKWLRRLLTIKKRLIKQKNFIEKKSVLKKKKAIEKTTDH